MTLARKAAALAAELRRPDASPGDKVIHVAQRGLRALGLSPRLEVSRRVIVELGQAPARPRGLSDLVVRRGDVGDVPALLRIDGADPALLRARLARGDLVYVALLDGEVLARTWFHRGPTPFEEERRSCASWALAASTFWSYDGAATVEARSSGVFVKLFQTALREVLQEPGVQRVQGYIDHTNRASLEMHRRMGFSVLGTVTAVALSGAKWLRWDGDGRARQWWLRPDGDFALSFPPA